MFQQTLWTQWAPIMHLSWVQRTLWNKSRKKSYEFFKIGLLHKYGVHYEFHANPPIFKKSKNGQKPHKFKNHLTSCFTKVQKLDLGWSDFKFGIFVNPPTSSLWDLTHLAWQCPWAHFLALGDARGPQGIYNNVLFTWQFLI